jgi:hypothetical protein
VKGTSASIKAGDRSGVMVAYVKSRRLVRVGGWYDSFVGIEGFEKPLAEFLTELGITDSDVRRALARSTAEIRKSDVLPA